MPRASTQTLLSLSRYAQIIGLDPLHFCQGVSAIRGQPPCSEIWHQYDWQDPDRVSREQLGILVAEAERDIAGQIHYWPAPTWIEGDEVPYSRPYLWEYYGRGGNLRNRYKTVRTRWGYVMYGGQRAADEIGTDNYTTIDVDGDGFFETAQFVFPTPAGLTDECEVRAYFKEYDVGDAANTRTDPSSAGADPAWEVRPTRVQIAGGNVTVWIYVWELFRPQLQEALNATEIDADDAASYVDELLFYRVYNDPQTQVEFVWGSDISCGEGSACAEVTQAGCMRVKDPKLGIVVPQPGTYDAGTFSHTSWTGTVEPDAVRLWYRAGYVPERNAGCDMLAISWARTIAMLATARLEWPLCECTNAALMADRWREEVTKITDQRSFVVSESDLENPFGTRLGEVLAWRSIVKSRDKQLGEAVLT